MSPLLSLIITTYNLSPCIDRTLASVRVQTLQALEIILIDDKSTDDTFLKLKAYGAQDTRVVLLQNERNSGHPSEGRNQGVQIAKGKYVSYMDGDDFLSDEGALKRMVDAMEESQAELGIAHYYMYDEEKDTRVEEQLSRNFTHKKTGALTFHYTETIERFWIYFHSGAGGKCYALSFLKKYGIEFLPIYMEDIPFSIMTVCAAARIRYIPSPIYTFTLNRQGGGNRNTDYSLSQVEDGLKGLAFARDWLREQKIPAEEEWLRVAYKVSMYLIEVHAPWNEIPHCAERVRDLLRGSCGPQTRYTHFNDYERAHLFTLFDWSTRDFLTRQRTTYAMLYSDFLGPESDRSFYSVLKHLLSLKMHAGRGKALPFFARLAYYFTRFCDCLFPLKARKSK